MSENPGFEGETDFGGFGEKIESVASRKSSVSQSEIKIEDEKIFSPEDDIIPEPYAGMPAEVLLLHSRKRGWVIGRAIGWLVVVCAFGSLIGISVTIIAKSSPCLDFWEASPIYQLYPRSFKDCEDPDRMYDPENNPGGICGDGVGDLLGIIDKLDYLSDDLGIKVVWLNPVYESPMQDYGYDVADYRKVHHEFGTNDDLILLITEMHSRGMKLMMDFVPNHTSHLNELFINATTDEAQRDLYVWHDGEIPERCDLESFSTSNGTSIIEYQVPNEACSSCHLENICPNNWQSVFSKNDAELIPAWTYHPTVKKYYYRAFANFQPDLNLRNPLVMDELVDILDFWMDLGIDGFRVDAIGYSLENAEFRNEIVKNETEAENGQTYWGNLYHDFTYEFGAFHDIIMSLREVMDLYSTEPGVDRMMITEATSTSTKDLMRYYGVFDRREADFPMNFGLMALGLDGTLDQNIIKTLIQDWMVNMPDGRVANWIISSHDEKRIMSRLANLTEEERENLPKIFAQLLMTLPGTPFIYYGQELGMSDLDLDEHPKECQLDVQAESRDGCRSPFRWTNSSEENYGFSTCSNDETSDNECERSCTWLPVGYKNPVNVDDQQRNPNSVFNYYKWLINNVRTNDEFTRGEICTSPNSNVPFHHYYRALENGDLYEVMINWTRETIRNVVHASGPEVLLPPGATSTDTPDTLGPFSGKIIKYSGMTAGEFNPGNRYDGRTCFQRRPVKRSMGTIFLK